MVLGLAFVLAGCATQIDRRDPNRGHVPQSPAMVSQSVNAGADANSPVLIRIFKETRELEVWRMNKQGRYVLVKNYGICSYSGHLGPKHRTGDRQAPEGFYTISKHQLNFNSIEYLSVNLGFPNQFDRSHGRTGSFLMIHGGCSSAGCYAIEDQPMQELFTAVRDALRAGQKSVQVHVYPFRMTEYNMQRYKTNPNFKFWQQLKVGYDRFNTTQQDLVIKVVNKEYKVLQ